MDPIELHVIEKILEVRKTVTQLTVMMADYGRVDVVASLNDSWESLNNAYKLMRETELVQG